MRKIISVLAALSIICGIGTSTYTPFVSVGTVSAAEVGETNTYDFEGSDKKDCTYEENGMVFDIYERSSDSELYAILTSVEDDSITELTIPDSLSLSAPLNKTISEGIETKEDGTEEIEVTINEYPPDVVGIADGAFENCKELGKINLSKNIAVLNWGGITEYFIAEMTVDEENKNFTAADGILYSKDMKTLIGCPPAIAQTEIKVSDKTEEIGQAAFVCCKDIKKIELPDSVTDIKSMAFFGCSAIEEMKLSESLKSIGVYAFAGCTDLKELTIPESVESIESDAFRDAGCTENYNGIVYVDNWAVGSDYDIESGDIRDGTVGTAVGLFASRNNLMTISVPPSVKHVGSYLAFGLNMPLERVDFYCSEIPERCLVCFGVKEICIYDDKCRIADASSSLPAYWREVERREAKEDYQLDYSFEKVLVTSANSQASSLKKAISTSLIELDDDDDDVDVSTITRTSGSNTVPKISSGGDDTSTYEKIKRYMDEKKSNDESGPRVYNAPVKKDGNIRYDTIINGNDDSAAQAYALKYKRCFEEFMHPSANVGPEIKTDEEAGITYWIYSRESASARLDGDHKEYKDVVIPDNIDGVPVTSFVVNCNLNAGKVTLPASVKYFDDSIDLQYDNTEYYIVSEDNPWYKSVDGIIYNKDMTELVKVPSNYEAGEIVVPDSVKTIRRGACHSLKNVSKITLPEGLAVIGANAFCGASKLNDIVLPESVETICDNAFNGCVSLTDINIPDNVTHIGYNAFDECPAVSYEYGHGYLCGWLVDVEDAVKDVAPKYDTAGIARITAKGSITIPRSVSKMSWEMIPDDGVSIMERADVYSHKLSYDAFKSATFLKDIYIYDPDCEICEGPQTIPAQHLEFDSYSGGIRSVFEKPWNCNALSRTPAKELRAYAETNIADTVIHGYKGSTAEVYAEFYGIKFSAIEDEPIYKNGDLNGDGVLSVADMLTMKRYLLGKTQFTEEQFRSADLNGDGKADIFDLVRFREEVLLQPERDDIL